MPVATPEQYAEMLDRAAAGGCALAAVNATSSQTLNGALAGFAEAESDGIVQVTTGGAAYFSGPAKDMAAGARGMAEMTRAVAEHLPVLVALHTDHCPPAMADAFVRPLLAESRERRARSLPPLFNSHMFDGSSLPLEDNLRASSELLGECAELDVVLEVETGVVGGEEDGVSGEGASASERYTTTADFLRVIEVLGAGERGRYLLAATFGNVHGVHAAGSVELRPEVLAEGQRVLEEQRPGARFQYVFHGSSGSADDEVREAIANGVVKINVDTDMQYAFTRAIADHVLREYDGVLRLDGGVGRKKAYDPRSWGSKAEAAVAQRVAETAELFGSSGRSLLR
jgi:fructose-bisphosphate aldolase, class II